MGNPIRHSWILAIASMLALCACGKLTPSTAGAILQNSDSRTCFTHLHSGKYLIGAREEKFRAAGLTEFVTPPGTGAREAEIALTPLGEQEIRRVRAISCGSGCWDVPLGDRTNIEVVDLKGGQQLSERIDFTWELLPNSIGREYGLAKATYQGTADFKHVAGQWVVGEISDGSPAM